MDLGIEPGIYTGIYIGKEMVGFKHNHNYTFKLAHNGRFYEVTTISDNTEDEESNLYIPYSSEKSIKHNWDIIYDQKE